MSHDFEGLVVLLLTREKLYLIIEKKTEEGGYIFLEEGKPKVTCMASAGGKRGL